MLILLNPLPYTSYFLAEFNRFPELFRTSGLFPGLSSPGKCHNKISGLSRFSRTRTNPVKKWRALTVSVPLNPLPHIHPCMHHLFKTHALTRPSTFHYLVRRSSQTVNHPGQQTQDELFREVHKTLYSV